MPGEMDVDTAQRKAQPKKSRKGITALCLLLAIAVLSVALVAVRLLVPDAPAGAHAHSYSLLETVQPGCLEEGYELYRCDGCESTYRNYTAAPTGHGYQNTVVQPTEGEQGYTMHTCSRCGDSYKDTFVDRLTDEDLLIWEKNLLSADECTALDAAENAPVFGSNILRSRICTVTFLDSLKNAPAVSWDVSANQDGSVRAWILGREGSDGLYELYLAAEGGICAPANCRAMFAGYQNLEQILGMEHFHLDRAEALDWMFLDCKKLETVDLSLSVPTEVQSLSGMFAGCAAIDQLDLSGWNTSKTRAVNAMFQGCTSLKQLVLGTLEVDAVELYAHFMDAGMLVNGKPWKSLFSDSSTPWKYNILMSDDYTYTIDGRLVIGDGIENRHVFGSSILRKEILTVTFLDTLRNAPANAWDVSLNEDGAVLAWVVPHNGLYDLYIAAEGGIRAPANCKALFAGYENLIYLNFDGCFHTDYAQEFTFLLYNCKSARKLELQDLVTDNVRDMMAMFQGCNALAQVDVTGWNTARVENTTRMFFNCYGLESMQGISAFDTSSLVNMTHMFAGCRQLNNIDLSGWNTARVTNMSGVFRMCSSLENVELGVLETGAVTEYSDFMDAGKQYNGKPWEELFDGK